MVLFTSNSDSNDLSSASGCYAVGGRSGVQNCAPRCTGKSNSMQNSTGLECVLLYTVTLLRRSFMKVVPLTVIWNVAIAPRLYTVGMRNDLCKLNAPVYIGHAFCSQHSSSSSSPTRRSSLYLLMLILPSPTSRVRLPCTATTAYLPPCASWNVLTRDTTAMSSFVPQFRHGVEATQAAMMKHRANLSDTAPIITTTPPPH